MKKYETLIFDLDDTLIDNNQSIKYAFTTIIKKLEIPFSEELFEKWKKFDTSYWHTWESGKMTVPDTIKTLEDKITFLRANRFVLFFQHLNLDFKTSICAVSLGVILAGIIMSLGSKIVAALGWMGVIAIIVAIILIILASILLKKKKNK